MGTWYRIVIVLIVLLFVMQCLLSLSKKSPTFDEVLFIPSGYAFLRTGSTLSNPEAQPLPRILSALPLLALNPKISPGDPQFTKRYEWGADFLFRQNAGQTERLVFWARIPVILLGAGLLILIFHWSKTLFGPSAGLIALAFAALDPNLIAHSSLATSDLPFTFFFVLSLYLFASSQPHSPRTSTTLLTACALAAALLCKTTAWLLLPIFFILMFIREVPNIRREIFRTLLIFTIAIVIVNAAFVFSGTLHDKADMMRELSLDPGENFTARLLLYFLPDQYAFPFIYNLAESSGRQHPFPFFLNGAYSHSGFWNYFFVALFIKTPISVLVWVLLSLLVLVQQKDRRRAITLCLPWVLLLLYFSFVNKLNLGLRHILPVYPLWFVIAGAPIAAIAQRRAWLKPLAYVCLLWSCLCAFRIQPHHLAYFNEFIGGPAKGFHYLVDSNLDWGQDLTRLKDYMQSKNIDRVFLSYFGTADPAAYEISYEYIPSARFQPWTLRHPDEGVFALKNGTYAISATNLQGVYLRNLETYTFFKNRKPDDRVGYSILIFRY